MKGWEFTGTHQPLKIVEKPDPTAKPGYVVLKTLAGGLCHSDVSALDIESWMGSFNVPVIMGHEVCGEIVEIGEGVEGYEIGDIVAVCPLYAKDGTTPGYTRDGGYGTMTTAPVEQLVKVPEGLAPAKAAAATDAGATSYHAVCTVGGVGPGVKVGIIGVGGLGQFAVRIAVLKGAEVYVATRKPSAQERALSLGAKEVKPSITDFADKNLDVIIDFAGAGKTTADALNTVKQYGKVVLVGMASDTSEIYTYSMIFKELTFMGSQGSTTEDLAGCLELLASGELDPKINICSFDEIAEGIDKLRRGEIDGRLVCLYD
ncbi:MAG: zinc-binding dehydrogenase [Lachnospiraceae bacterium]|nr:zinc-binding dehydrogenase [Lachnospiraceae bacterium]MDO4734950.1 zinc-binding dehydrogenase [Lachnospiraceae bacterium]